MHYIKRGTASKKIKDLLESSNKKHKENWKLYNKAKKDNQRLPTKPSSTWNNDIIRNELKILFLKNCGYCGIHTDKGHEAEVDHFFPKSEDLEANLIYNWNNFIWSCPSCNRKKSSNYPIINPCDEDEMDQIYFHSADGRYLPFHSSTEDLKTKFSNTEEYTFINGKNRPERREYIYRDVLENHLRRINLIFSLFEVEKEVKGKNSKEAKEKFTLFQTRKNDFLKLIRCGDYLYLIKYIMDDYISENPNFPFNFDQAIEDSQYLEQ
ncbi:HNH endonuclease [Salinimicrobium sp. WS361]|uniref:HNH endonuclease n=1 Tax=Salinimicrobium sp. WS361 TaxID=3425123 RepID=UPI003D701DDF